jgi:hypothetical protein
VSGKERITFVDVDAVGDISGSPWRRLGEDEPALVGEQRSPHPYLYPLPSDLSCSGTIPLRTPDLFCYPPSRTESADSRLPSYTMSGRALASDRRARSFRKANSRKGFANASGGRDREGGERFGDNAQ